MNNRIGIPISLSFHDFFPLWIKFFEHLDREVIVSDKVSRKIIEDGLISAKMDICYPIKVALGQVHNLVKKGAREIFFPTVVEELQGKNELSGNNFNCPYIQSFPIFAQDIIPKGVKVVSPVFPFLATQRDWVKALCKLARQVGYTGKETTLTQKIHYSLDFQKKFRQQCQREGKQFLRQTKERAVVIFARAYTLDAAFSINIPRIFTNEEINVVPYDFLSFSDTPVPAGFEENTWHFGKDYLKTASLVAGNSRLYPVIVTCFNCGPDSFFIGHLRKIFSKKPLLEIEIDEHFSDEAIRTRIEAFATIIKESKPAAPQTIQLSNRTLKNSLRKKIYIPFAADNFRAFEGAFVNAGLEAEILPPADDESEALGRKYTIGRECYPFILFTGDLVRLVQKKGFNPNHSTLLSLGGGTSCRAGEYGRALRRILFRLNVDMSILDPHISSKTNELIDLFGVKITSHIWRGWAAIDYLYKFMLEVRPHEQKVGETDRAYKQGLQNLVEGIGRNDFIERVKLMRDTLDTIAPLAKRESNHRPLIGLIGEHYTQYSSHANNNLIKTIETLGGVVFPAPHFTDYNLMCGNEKWKGKMKRKELLSASFSLLEFVGQFKDEKKIARLFDGYLFNHPEPSLQQIIDYATHYISRELDPVIVLSIAKAIDFAEKGVDGLINVMPLGCLFNYIPTLGIFGNIAEQYKIPMLNLRFDGLKYTNQFTRIDAFMNLAMKHKLNEC